MVWPDAERPLESTRIGKRPVSSSSTGEAGALHAHIGTYRAAQYTLDIAGYGWRCLLLGLRDGLVGVEGEGGSDVAGGVGVGESVSDFVCCFPACAVAGND